jgi:hypothetical protein
VKVFVLGRSRTGKTPFAKRVAEATGAAHLMASEWVRSRFPDTGHATRDAYVQAITAFSLEELRRDPSICVDYIRAHHDLTRPCVIEGVRNPYDFVHLFDPRADQVVLLDHRKNDLTETVFERGLDVIRRTLDHLAATGLLARPVVAFAYDEIWEGVEAAIHDFLAAHGDALKKQVAESKGERPREARVHQELPRPIKLHVRREFLHDMDPRRVGEVVPCTAFAFSSYEGSAPTVKILLGDGAVFSYVPPHALIDPARRKAPELELADLAYHNCPAAEISVHAFAALEGKVLAYLKRKDLWLAGEYLFTVDWYTGNDLLHFVALENGQFAFLPHHKLKFGRDTPGFEPYKKLRRAWAV